MDERTPLIETRHLKKYFSVPDGKLHAVDDVNLKIYPGETLGIVGESGCGKSTLGRTILRLIEPTDGEIYFNGENICTYNKAQMRELRKKMQIIFQDPYSSINPRMTVEQIIAEYMIVNKSFNGDRKKIREAGRYFMVSNRHAFLGAGTLLYSGKYREIAEKVGTDLYLLPTSVHEVMTVPAPGHTPEEMRRLLASIMSEDPKKEHCLTENVYYYSAEKGSILIAL